MIGRFLELGLQSRNILDSIGFYEDLGFKQLSTGDIWPHPYAVVSDGVVNIGLHTVDLAMPMLTFVLPGLADERVEFRSRGVEFEVEKTGDDQFNELVFSDPDENCAIRVVEARTFSPAPFAPIETTCGRFREITLPASDLTSASAFWQRMGFEELDQADSPHPHIWLRGNGIVLGLHDTPAIRHPALSFQTENMAVNLARLDRIGIRTDGIRAPAGVVGLSSPEKLSLLMHGI